MPLRPFGSLDPRSIPVVALLGAAVRVYDQLGDSLAPVFIRGQARSPPWPLAPACWDTCNRESSTPWRRGRSS
eukprot:7799820-Lingulodinium_polyedra.AAC.1